MNLKAVTFDVGGTLSDSEGLDKARFGSLLVSYLQDLGHRVSTKDYRKAVGLALNKLARIRKHYAEMKFDDFYSSVLSKMGVNSTELILKDVRSMYYDCFLQQIKEGVEDMLKELRGRYKLAIVSNSMSLVPKDFLERHGLSEYFDATVISGEVGIRKPKPELFEHALKLLGVKPSDAIHVGDSLREDVLGAQAAGMKTIWVSEKALKTEVQAKPDAVVRSIDEVPRAIELMRV